ncbi:MAG: hypothetical protein ABS43_21755 [Bordetella sp. SCN 67-23]|nr:MAG: hypothetical protein ABS43_21755 [Bordetella sp. SCN 67-23]OJW90007.1 MAG: hypothetical protein BGO71_27200 [Burkholderiales bacterium 67-32]
MLYCPARSPESASSLFPGGHAQEIQCGSCVDLLESTHRHHFDVGESFDVSALEQGFSVGTLE